MQQRYNHRRWNMSLRWRDHVVPETQVHHCLSELDKIQRSKVRWFKTRCGGKVNLVPSWESNPLGISQSIICDQLATVRCVTHVVRPNYRDRRIHFWYQSKHKTSIWVPWWRAHNCVIRIWSEHVSYRPWSVQHSRLVRWSRWFKRSPGACFWCSHCRFQL